MAYGTSMRREGEMICMPRAGQGREIFVSNRIIFNLFQDDAA